MKLTIPKSDLLKSLSAASRALPKSDLLPDISCLFMDINGSQLVIKATDLEVEVISKVEFDTTETLSVLLPPNIVPIVGSLSASDVDLAFDLEKSKVTVKSGASKFTLYAKNVEDYPVISERMPSGNPITFTQKELRTLLEQAVFCVSTDEARPQFTTVAFLFGEDELQVLSSDTYRLTHRVEEGKGWGTSKMMLVPSKALKELLRLLGNNETAVDVFPDKECVVFRSSEFYFAARVITEKYPDISGLVPKKHKTEVVVPVREFIAQVNRVAMVSDGKNRSVRIKLDEDKLELSAESELGRANEEVVPEKREGENIDLHINATFLLDALGAISGKSVKIGLNGSAGPVVVYDNESDNWLCLILPIKQSN